ncbi:MAG: hypothetical protein Q8T09_13980 [Candidatus Melainabacteria bacterium]|nr:hypothetical protein [Candidatus Melainabacteria bacterium]
MSRLEQSEALEKSSSLSFSGFVAPELQTSNRPLRDNSNANALLKSQFGDLEIVGVPQFDKSNDKPIDKPILVAENIRLFEGLPSNVRQHFVRIRDGVSDAFNEPFSNRTKGLNGLEILKDLTVGGYLGKNTNEPPMFDDAYSAKVTRPYEQKLMKDLQADQGAISQKTLVERAMFVCNNDKYLATLTLANFTKNIASVERGQAPVTDSPRPDMGYPFDTFSKKQSDNVFNRLEKFDEGAKNKLSKVDSAGTLYHFYGGILASSAGLGFEVHGENAIFGWSRDPIKREAGSLGDQVGQKVFGPNQQFNDAFKNLIGR